MFHPLSLSTYLSERYWNSTKSKLSKKGEPESHLFCKEIICKVLEKRGYYVERESRLKISGSLGRNPGFIMPLEYKHDYDIHIVTKSNMHFFIEIGAGDDDSRHSNEREGALNIKKSSKRILRKQSYNDERAEQVLRFFLETNLIEIYRVSKDDILGKSEQEVEKYLIDTKIISKYGN